MRDKDTKSWRRAFYDIHWRFLRLVAVLWIVVGGVIFFLSYLVAHEKIEVGHPGFGWAFVAGFMQMVGAAIFAVGAVNILLDLPSVMDYVSDRIDDLRRRDISDPSFLSALGTPALEVAHANILRALHDIDFSVQEGSPYQTLRAQIEPLLGELFYERLDVNIENEVVRQGGTIYIKSKRVFKMQFISPKEQTVDLGFERNLRPIPGVPNQDLYKLRCLSVDGVEVTGISPQTTLGPSGEFVVSVALPRRLLAGVRVLVDRRETTLIPATDIIQWICREKSSLLHLDVKCRFNELVYPKIYRLGFASSDHQVLGEEASSCEMTWDGWMLPHHGFVVSWNDPQP